MDLPLLPTIDSIQHGYYHAVIAALSHNEFAALDPRPWLAQQGILYDVKELYGKELADGRL